MHLELLFRPPPGVGVGSSVQTLPFSSWVLQVELTGDHREKAEDASPRDTVEVPREQTGENFQREAERAWDQEQRRLDWHRIWPLPLT